MNFPSEMLAAGAGEQILKFFSSLPGLLLVLVAFMWIFMLKSKRNQDRQRQELLNKIKKGDRVQTIGGILGTVVEVRDQEDEIVVKVDESSNTKMRFIRAAISRVVQPAEREKAEVKS